MIEKNINGHTSLYHNGKTVAEITINPRDAMVLVTININDEELPPESLERLNALKSLHDYLKKEYGAKIILVIPSRLLTDIQKIDSELPGFMHSHQKSIELIDMDKFKSVVAEIREKPHVQKACDAYQLADSKLITTVKFNQKMAAFKTKPGNASFVNSDKIKQGLYSAEGEWYKSNNPHSIQLALIDKEGEIAATLMLAFDAQNQIAYGSDLIVDQSKRSKSKDNPQGLAQALVVYAFTRLSQKYPSLLYVCFIEGGDKTPAQTKLYHEIFGSYTATTSKASSLTITAMFQSPGPKLLDAANRSPDLTTSPSGIELGPTAAYTTAQREEAVAKKEGKRQPVKASHADIPAAFHATKRRKVEQTSSSPSEASPTPL